MGAWEAQRTLTAASSVEWEKRIAVNKLYVADRGHWEDGDDATNSM